MKAEQHAVFAIDGGGTGCRLALEEHGEVRVVGAGPANAFTGFDAAVAAIEDGLERLSDATGWPVGRIKALPGCAAVAGVIDAGIAQRLRGALGLENALVEEDRPAMLEGALGSGDGALAALGTGSFFALKVDGGTRFAGGWGGRLSDRASAHWIGREALSAALDAHDGVGSGTGLTEDLLTRFAGPVGLVSFAEAAPPRDIADLAPLVSRASTAGDIVATGILRRAAGHVADMFEAFGVEPGLPVCLAGGAAPPVAEYLAPEWRARLVEPRGRAIDGALARAREWAAGGLR